ncbi:MAG: glycoside hydrolase [Candidatus Omnitrophica bacterium]|nr:glycoside hydrolase [Candidatus Omnitrophota bacterium]
MSAAKQKRKILKTLIPIFAILLVAGAIAGMRMFKHKPQNGSEFQKGMVYCTWSESGYMGEEADKSLVRVSELGTKWVAILVTWYQTNCWTVDIHRTTQTPSDEAVIHTIRKAHELGMKVMIKLHLDLSDTSDGSWRGEIGCTREEDWEKWFKQYTEYVDHYAAIAEKEKAEMVCVGTELTSAATVKGYMWRDVIKSARSKYSGALTYAAHWDSYQDIRFWDILDYVGINAYFPLTEKLTPTYDELMEGWKKWLPEIEEFQARTGKPIIFPEIGCNSADGAAIRPWEHCPRSEVNLKLQEDYYKALLDTFWNKEWFYGLYWWYWGTNINMGGKYNRGFTPQNKPAEDVIKDWYAKSVRK